MWAQVDIPVVSNNEMNSVIYERADLMLCINPTQITGMLSKRA
jgi:hypothetical protein